MIFLDRCPSYATFFRAQDAGNGLYLASTAHTFWALTRAESNAAYFCGSSQKPFRFDPARYEPRTGDGSFAAVSAAAACFNAASFAARAAALREPRPESRLNCRILYSNAL